MTNRKRFESGEGTKGPLIYDNTGVDDYYFINDPEERTKFIDLINSIEDDWKSLYDCLEEKYLKVLNEVNDKTREITQLKKEIQELKQK